MSLILACDPGKASGFALYDFEKQKALWMKQSERGVLGFSTEFETVQEWYRPEHIACESFNLRPGNKFLADLSPVECIGWLRGQRYDVEYVTPAQHKTLVKDKTLNPLMKDGNFKVGAGHSRDALRIAVWYAAKVLNHRPTLEMLKPKDS